MHANNIIIEKKRKLLPAQVFKLNNDFSIKILNIPVQVRYLLRLAFNINK